MKPNPYREAERALDDARDAFTRAAAALTLGNRIRDRSFLACALLEGAYGLMKLAQGDIGERGFDEATEHLKELRKEEVA